MPSPIAHVGLAWALQLASRPRDLNSRGRDVLLVAFAAVAPDFDLLVDLLGGPGLTFHHGPTHSVLGAVVIAAALAPMSAHSATRWCVLAALLLHIVLDWTTGEPGAPRHYGVAAFWPFTATRWIDSTPWFLPYHIDASGGLRNMFVASAVPAYLREVGTVAVGMVAAATVRAWRLRTRTRGP